MSRKDNAKNDVTFLLDQRTGKQMFMLSHKGATYLYEEMLSDEFRIVTQPHIIFAFGDDITKKVEKDDAVSFSTTCYEIEINYNGEISSVKSARGTFISTGKEKTFMGSSWVSYAPTARTKSALAQQQMQRIDDFHTYLRSLEFPLRGEPEHVTFTPIKPSILLERSIFSHGPDEASKIREAFAKGTPIRQHNQMGKDDPLWLARSDFKEQAHVMLKRLRVGGGLKKPKGPT